MTDKWIIKDGIAIPEPDLMTWARWLELEGESYHRLDTVLGIRISTVFLGLNYSWGDGDPILWETMVFDDDDGGTPLEQFRCSFQDQAYLFHDKLVLHYKAMLTPLIPLQ